MKLNSNHSPIRRFHNATQLSPLFTRERKKISILYFSHQLQTDPETGLRSRIAALKTSSEKKKKKKKEIREGTTSYSQNLIFLVSRQMENFLNFSSRMGWKKITTLCDLFDGV